jgi:hypothetical protein
VGYQAERTGETPKERTLDTTTISQDNIRHIAPNGQSEPSYSEDVEEVKEAPVLFSLDLPRKPTQRFKLWQASIESAAAGGPKEVFAEVRIVNLTDRALTQNTSNPVDAMIRKLFYSNDRKPVGQNKDSRQNMSEVQRRTREVAYVYACVGFVNPRVCLTEEEENISEGIYWAGRFPLNDLSEFVRMCEGNEELAASRLSAFPE